MATVRRGVVGFALITGLVAPIALDAYTQYAGAPVEYVQAKEPEVARVVMVRPEWTPETIDAEIVRVAEKYGVSASLMRKIIQCESMGSTTIQSYHVLGGKREESFGLAQIHLPSHPNVTKEEATDPAFAIDFLGRHVDETPEMWSCYHLI